MFDKFCPFGRVQESSPLVLAVLAAIAVGAAIGVLQGALVAKLGLSAIMATLATLIWARGLTLAINVYLFVMVAALAAAAIGVLRDRGWPWRAAS